MSRLGQSRHFDRCPLFVGWTPDRHRHGGRRDTHPLCQKETRVARNSDLFSTHPAVSGAQEG